MIEGIDVRFFVYANKDEDEFGYTYDIFEVSERQFMALYDDYAIREKGTQKLSYERHSVFDNGVRQVCLTLDTQDWPHEDELETIQH